MLNPCWDGYSLVYFEFNIFEILLKSDLSDQYLRQVYMEHCAKLMSMQKLFRHNLDAKEAEKLVLSACFELQKLLEPYMTTEESEDLGLQLAYAQA